MGSSTMNTSSDAERSARLGGKRVALAVVTTIAVAFIGDSALQIVPAVFGLDAAQSSSALKGVLGHDCAQRIRPLALAIDRASAHAWSTHAVGTVETGDPNAPLRAFHHALLPEWGDAASVREGCFKSPGGAEAWAALVRLRGTEEQMVVRDSSELLRARGEFAAHLPADLR
jgi:hypothetical protein